MKRPQRNRHDLQPDLVKALSNAERWRISLAPKSPNNTFYVGETGVRSIYRRRTCRSHWKKTGFGKGVAARGRDKRPDNAGLSHFGRFCSSPLASRVPAKKLCLHSASDDPSSVCRKYTKFSFDAVLEK